MKDFTDIANLTRAMRRSDEAAWRHFHETYYDRIYALVRARGISESDAGDVIQRAYLKILRSLKPFTNESDFRAWVCCVVRSESIDMTRKQQRSAGLLDKFRGWFESNPVSDSRIPLLEGMDESDRRLLERHYAEGWSQAELAAEADISVKAMESRLARLRLRARSWLNKGGK